jgi:hypothetical protein
MKSELGGLKMGHHHRAEVVNEPQTVENFDKSVHPFLHSNDLTFLSIILPLLSEPGKQLLSFFINFGNPKPVNNIGDPLSLLKQIAPKIENSGFQEILPTLMTLLSNQDNKSALNPALLSSLLANMGTKKEE